MNYNESDFIENNTKVKSSKENKLYYPLLIMFMLLIIETTFVVCLIVKISSTINESTYLATTKSDETSEDLSDTLETLEEIDKYYSGAYVNDIDYDDLTLKMGNALIASYGDKYGVYLDPELTNNQNAELNNELSGIGVLVRAEVAESEDDFDRLYVIEAYKGSDALDKGITTGSLITAINGNKINFAEQSYDDVIGEIRGDAGTTVDITFLDKEGKENTYSVERRMVETTTVKYKVINNNIGYINIRDFTYSTDEEFKAVIEYMSHRNIDKFIFDLRDNTGGLLDTVVNMLDTLLKEKDLIYIENKDKEIVETYKSDSNGYEFDAVCIINGNSASASELFVKSLQEEGHTVVGTQSYGKGTVCSVIPLENGGSLQLSTFRYLTSSKECVEGIGITPDIELKLPEHKEAIQYKLDIKDDDIIIESVKLLSE